MKILKPVAIALSLSILASCGGGSTADQASDHLETVTSILTSITDVDSAKANKDKLAAAMQAYTKFGEAQAEKAKDMSPEEIAAEQKEMAEEMKAMEPKLKKMMEETMRIASDPAIAAALGNALTGGGE